VEVTEAEEEEEEEEEEERYNLRVFLWNKSSTRIFRTII